MDSDTLVRDLKSIARLSPRAPQRIGRRRPTVARALRHNDPVVIAHACWAAGMMGFARPGLLRAELPRLARLMRHADPAVRDKAIWALGRIGRADPAPAKRYLPRLLASAADPDPRVRLSMIWACENLATVRPEWFAAAVPLFIGLLDDPDRERVRIEAPEIFRVLGKRRPGLVTRALPALKRKLRDANRVVRIHARGALRAIARATDRAAATVTP